MVGSAMKQPHSSQRLPVRQTASVSPYSSNVQGRGWCLLGLVLARDRTQVLS